MAWVTFELEIVKENTEAAETMKDEKRISN